MSQGTLWRISVAIAPESEEAVVELLEGLFGVPASVEFNTETHATVARVFCPRLHDWTPARRAALVAGLRRIRACGLALGPGKISARRIRREDWAESWKRHFKPMEFGDRLLIKPSWSRRRPVQNQAVVVLDPGLSFGTGQHPTTNFCLRHLVAGRRPGTRQSLLDIGTGSGILAICAAKLGYEPVEAFDFDPAAARIARTNARQNHIERQVHIVRRDLTTWSLAGGRKYDMICANLLEDLLLAYRRAIVQRLERAGTLLLAGLLRGQFARVRTAYEASGLKMVDNRAEREWQSGAFVRI